MELTGVDYLTLPKATIEKHPDFSPHAYRIMLAIGKMNTKEIEEIDLIGGKNRA